MCGYRSSEVPAGIIKEENMKILQINSHYDQGGAARIVACIHRQLLAEGIDSYVVYGRGQKAQEKNVYRFDAQWEVYLSAFFSRFVGLNGWWNRRATRRLITYIEKVQPDVIHMHALHGYYLNFYLLFKYINEHNIPCVWTFHDCHAFVGNCGYFFDCEKWQTGCGKCPHLKNYPTSQFFDFTHYMWENKKEWFAQGGRKVIVTPSDWLTAEARKSFFGKYPCVTIHNGIDVTNTFYPRNVEECRKKYGYSIEDKLVLGIAVGYRDPRKGAKYILQMAKDLENEAKIVLIGWNRENDSMLDGLTNVIPLFSTQNTEKLAEYYSMADVFVLPSLAENYATTALESMACGTPVVGFDVGGISEQLTDRKGIAVKTGDQAAFTEAVRQALDSVKKQDGRLLKGAELAEIIRKENSVERMITEYRKIYRQLL